MLESVDKSVSKTVASCVRVRVPPLVPLYLFMEGLMFRYDISIDSEEEIVKFVNIMNGIDHDVKVTDGLGNYVSAKSVLGLMYAMTFKKQYCESPLGIKDKIYEFLK